MDSIGQKLLDALNLWLEISEVDPNKSSFRISMGASGYSDYDVVKMHRIIKEALDLDPSNTTGVLMLDAMSTLYLKDRTFSIQQLLDDPEKAAQYVRKCAEFQALVRAPEFAEQNKRFVTQMRTALKMYAMDSDATLAMLDDLHELGYLRRDAFRSIQRLRVDQFLAGTPEPEGVRPVYNGWVHQFWNINTLVEAACRQPSGVTLSLIRDPDDLQSYFVFAIRNGGNLWLLSDVPEFAHPLQRYMSRKPERSYSARTARNWFPYDLLNLTYDEEAQAFFADEARRRSLIPQQQTVDRIKAISELAPQEVLWIVMMFDLIVEQFWHKEAPAKALSYTAAMIREETPLIDAAKDAQLPVTTYQTLSLAPLTKADMTAEKVAPAVNKDGGQPNAWLEARYADQVDDDVFNLLDSGQNTMYLPPVPAKDRHNQHKNHELAVVQASHVAVLTKDDAKLAFWHKEGRYPLHALNATMFGTRDELEKNRIFLARHNQAKAIQRLADEEFQQRKDEIVAWYTARVKKNIDHLLELAAADRVRRKFEPTEPGAQLKTIDGYRYDDGTFNFVRTYGVKDSAHGAVTVSLHNGYIHRRDNFSCYLTDAVSSYKVFFQPQTAKELAELAGCQVEDLPDVLQHWSSDRDHHGNHILDRIDPMAWALHDPWCKVDFRVGLFLSKRGLAQIQKRFPGSTAAGKADADARAGIKGVTTFTI